MFADGHSRKDGRFGGARLLLGAGCLALAAIGVVDGCLYLTSNGVTRNRSAVNAGAAASFPAQTVTYVPDGHFYLVRFDDDQFVALFERSPWLQFVHGAAPDECRIRWYTESQRTTRTEGNTTTDETDVEDHAGSGDRDPIGTGGMFIENCSGWKFDAHGERVFGASASLSRYAVTVSDGNVIVDTATLDNSWWRQAPSF